MHNCAYNKGCSSFSRDDPVRNYGTTISKSYGIAPCSNSSKPDDYFVSSENIIDGQNIIDGLRDSYIRNSSYDPQQPYFTKEQLSSMYNLAGNANYAPSDEGMTEKKLGEIYRRWNVAKEAGSIYIGPGAKQ